MNIDTQVKSFLEEKFSGSKPPSIILTGNAGDGKTYLCRKIIESFSGTFPGWNENDSNLSIYSRGLELRVVKDLSEIGEQEGVEILRALEDNRNSSDKAVFYLIAANEGRLRALLEQAALPELQTQVDQQLTGELAVSEADLAVINLNRINTSVYLPQVIAWLTDSAQWEECHGCPAIDACPIRFNASKLAEERVADRLKLLYKILEHTGLHITVREALVHLAYTVTGKLSCEQVTASYNEPGNELHEAAYYENCWGTLATEADLRKMTVARHLRPFDVGEYSLYEVDDFILHGDVADSERTRNEHSKIFAPSVDLNGDYFHQRRQAYLRGTEVSEKASDKFLELLPHCRRKLFFEMADKNTAAKLTPLLSLSEYLELLEGDKGKLDRAKKQLIVGLNRALTGLFVPDNDTLYATSQYAHAVESPVPIVRAEVPEANMDFRVEKEKADWVEAEHELILGIVVDPWGGGSPVMEHIDLLRFEYLMRLSRGGSYNVLAEECALFVRELKDKLLTSSTKVNEDDNQVKFFGLENDRYVLKKLYIDEQGGLST